MSELQLDLSAGVLTATLNRPDVRNALNRAVVDGLHRALDRADLEPVQSMAFKASVAPAAQLGASSGRPRAHSPSTQRSPF